MKRLSTCILIAVLALSFSACKREKTNAQIQKSGIDTVPMLVSQVQRCSKLYTAEYRVHKIVTHDDKIRVKGTILKHGYDIALPMGERKVAIPMDATVKAYIDFADFSERNISRKGRQVEIILPDPKVELTATKINHAEIKKYVALMRSNFSDQELANYQKQGRDAIVKDIPGMNITETAKESAAKVIVPIFVAMGYDEKNVTVTFRKEFTAADILKMVDPTTVIEGR